MFRNIENIDASRVLAAIAAVAVTLLLVCVPMTVVWFPRLGA